MQRPENAGTGSARSIRITLRYLEILDSKDFDTTGEFRFRFRVGVPDRGEVTETRIPDDPKGHLAISEHPAMNRLTFQKVLFEGEVAPGDSLVVEAEGTELDRLSPNDPLPPYRRVFEPPLDAALGEHGPWDEGGPDNRDPEQLGDWRFAYAIEAIEALPATDASAHAPQPADPGRSGGAEKASP